MSSLMTASSSVAACRNMGEGLLTLSRNDLEFYHQSPPLPSWRPGSLTEPAGSSAVWGVPFQAVQQISVFSRELRWSDRVLQKSFLLI